MTEGGANRQAKSVIYVDENINNTNTRKRSTIDDLLNDVGVQQKKKQHQQLVNNTLFSLPEIEPQSTHCPERQHESIIMLEHDRICSRLSWTRVVLHQVDLQDNNRKRTSGLDILSALKRLSQRDVMDALQYSSTRRLFSLYSEDEYTIVAKALVGATSMYAFPLEGELPQPQQKKKKQKHDALCAEALCSAYDAYRSRVFTFDDQEDPTEFILYVYAEGYTVVFQQSERDGMMAIVSRSTPGMRRMFDMYGIKHEAFGNKSLFRGTRNVHGLFDVLLNATGSIWKIVAPVPFQNASLVKTPFRLSSSSSSADVVISSRSKDVYIPPWVVSRLQYLLLMSSSSYTISTK